MNTLEQQFDYAKSRFADEKFQNQEGLANEVSLYIWCYDPAEELKMRKLTNNFCDQHKEQKGSYRIIKRSLWDSFLSICERKKMLNRINMLEEKRGSEGLQKRLQTIVSPEEYIKEFDWPDHEKGDILLITDVGRIYPFMRAHNILEAVQVAFADVPVVLQYPGEYNNQNLSLFGMHDANYYRAFNLLIQEENRAN